MKQRRAAPPAGAAALAGALALALSAGPAKGYVEAPYPLGRLVAESTNILLLRVEAVDNQKNTVVYAKVRDLKGVHKGDTIKHNIGRGGFHPREWQNIMAWAAPGKTAVFFHNGGASETCIDDYWYQAYAGEWWGMSHAEPYLLRTYAGKPEKLAGLVAAMLAGQEVVVPCMVDGDKNALQLRKAKLMRMKASLKIQDYNAQRDFAGWGVEEFRPVSDMPGFTHIAPLGRVDPGSAGIAPADVDGDGKPDFLLFGEGRVLLLQNGGGSLSEVALPVEGGARAAAWADADADAKPDLLLATPAGPRLLLNRGDKFEDASAGLPRQAYYNLTAAAWIDYDVDGRPDILLADGFRGLRLYRNAGRGAAPAAPALGQWFYAGPFDNPGGTAGFDAVYPPEKEVDLKKEYPGKGGEKVAWRPGPFRDGEINTLLLFKPELCENAVVYLYTELDLGGAADLPVSLGSDDTLTVWLNGQKVHAENVARSCGPDQAVLTLKLRPGRNSLLLKVCNGGGDFAFYYSFKGRAKVGPAVAAAPHLFEDVSRQVGLGSGGLGAHLKGDHLAVADVNGDGRPDVLYSAAAGLLLLNTPQGFVEAKDSGIAYKAGKVAPVFGDFSGDGRPDLFVPQSGLCKLFKNDGRGRFADVTAASGALAQALGQATCAAWADFGRTGRLDLLVGCLRGPNRYFRNQGDGTFADATDAIGFQQRIFNTFALAVLDLNGDGAPDVVLNNEGQDPAVLLGSRTRPAALAAAGP